MRAPPDKISNVALAAGSAVGAIALLLSVFAVGLENGATRESGTSNLTIGHLRPFAPDPHRTVLSNPAYHQMVYAAWEGLAEPDPLTGEPRPAAAESWNFSPEGRRLTIRLRNDGRWANGDPVTAHDFVRGWRRSACARETVFNAALQNIRGAEDYRQGKIGAEQFGVRATGELALEVDLVEPDLSLISEMCDSAWMPLHASSLDGTDERTARLREAGLFGNGAFGVIHLESGTGCMELRPNPWHREARNLPWQGIRFRHLERPAAAAALLRTGRIDCVIGLPEPAARRMCGDMPQWRQTIPENQVEVVNLNTARGPLRDARVRRALSLALDRRAGEAAINAATWLPPELQENQAVYQSDVEAARILLAEAGYPEGRGFPVLRWLCLPGTAQYPAILACTDAWWKELGIRVYVRPSNAAEYREQVAAQRHDIALLAWKGSSHDPLSLLDAFGSEGMSAFTNWRDERLAALKREVAIATGAARLGLLREMADLIRHETPAFPVRHRDRVLWRSPEIEWPRSVGCEERIRTWRRLTRS